MSLATAILPYPGLRAFTREESMLFFGREDCVDAMIERLAATRFLAVLGASGSGKSSLVRTGLFDGLELGFFARAGARWKIVETHPGGAPMRNLAEALARASSDGDRPEDIEALLVQGRRSLIEWAGGGRLGPGENLLVLVDQFEELFRYADYAAREEAESFVALLLESARAADLPIYIVITMRSEFLGACALIPGLAEQINAGFYLTPRMSREECRQAIEGPAAVAGFDIEASLANRVLNDMAALAPWEEERGVVQGQILSRRADQLPLMQHLLNRLWLMARDRSGDEPLVLTVDDYEAAGGLTGALDAHGAEIMASLFPQDREAAPRIFRALVSGPDTTNAVRRPSRFDALEAELATVPGLDDGAAQRVIDAFRAPGRNFLQPVRAHDLTPDTVVDISHESLIRQWSDLSGWLTDEARAAANWRRLLSAADANGKGEGNLLSGLDLATLDQWWASEQPNTVWASRHGGRYEEAKDFLDRSRAESDAGEQREALRDRRERRRLIAFSAGTGLLMSALGAFSVLYFIRGDLADASRRLRETQVQVAEAESFIAWSKVQIRVARRQADAASKAANTASRQAKDKALESKALLKENQKQAQAAGQQLETMIRELDAQKILVEKQRLQAERRTLDLARRRKESNDVANRTIAYCSRVENVGTDSCKEILGDSATWVD